MGVHQRTRALSRVSTAVVVLGLLVVLVEVRVASVELLVDLAEVTQVMLLMLLVLQARITLSFLKYLKHPSCVMAKLMVVIMLILKLNARLSTSVPMMEVLDSPSIASCAQMEHSSNSNTLFVTGGLMWTVLLLKSSIRSMMKLLLRELLILLKVPMVLDSIKEEQGRAVAQGEVAVDHHLAGEEDLLDRKLLHHLHVVLILPLTPLVLVLLIHPQLNLAEMDSGQRMQDMVPQVELVLDMVPLL